MLGKLLKYEVKATSRTFLPLFGVLLLFTVINKLFFVISPSNFSLPQGISMTVYVVTLIGIAVATMLITIQRFYKNLLGDEGYLMFTLPVKPWQLVTSKLMVSGLWCIVSTLVGALSIVVMAVGMSDLRALPTAWQQAMQALRAALGISPALFISEIIIVILAGLVVSIITIYLSIALGHQLNSKKLLGSFGAFLVVTTVIQTVTTLLAYLISKLGDNTAIFDGFSTWSASSILHLGLWIVIAYEVITTAICFFCTNKLLQKRLNLE